MKISGTADLAAPPDQVFSALNDPAVLAATIPGVQSLDKVGPDVYTMTVNAGVASIKGSYDGQVQLADQRPPESFTLRASGSGAPGTVDATVRVTLEPAGSGTRLAYDADAIVGGMIGGVGQRMLAGVSRKMAGQFFGAVDQVIAQGVPEPALAGATAQPRGEGVAAVPAQRRAAELVRADDDHRVPFWVVLAGVGAGAFWALAGVVVGYAISRRRRD